MQDTLVERPLRFTFFSLSEKISAAVLPRWSPCGVDFVATPIDWRAMLCHVSEPAQRSAMASRQRRIMCCLNDFRNAPIVKVVSEQRPCGKWPLHAECLELSSISDNALAVGHGARASDFSALLAQPMESEPTFFNSISRTKCRETWCQSAPCEIFRKKTHSWMLVFVTLTRRSCNCYPWEAGLQG